MTGPRIAIVQLIDPEGTIPVAFSASCFEFACELMAQGCSVSVIPWQSTPTAPIDALLHDLAVDSDRVLLWDPDVTFDLPATIAALGGVKLLEALDAADVITAPVIRGPDQLAVFSSRELFSRAREGLGTDLAPVMQRDRKPVVIAAAGCYWLWIHTSATARLGPAPAKPYVIDGIDVTLVRRLIEGGCTARCDPRLAVTSSWRYSAPWGLGLAPKEEAAPVAVANAETAPVPAPLPPAPAP
jgi:hypothetical protein